MRLIIFGANGKTGRLLTRQALDEGHDVTAYTRHPETFPIEHSSLRVAAGDVQNADEVEKAVSGQDAVLSSLGVPFGRQPITVYSTGASHILAAMQQVGVDRFVGVTSSAVEAAPEPLGGFMFERVVQPFVVGVLGRSLYEDMRRMEAIVTASGSVWTIVRPSGLFTSAGVSDYDVSAGHAQSRFTSRADLADCLLREVDGRRPAHLHEVVAVSTTAEQPSLAQLIWREGIRKKG